jgi:hypothetical protein
VREVISFYTPYSCELNQIETYWAHIKRLWFKHLIDNGRIKMTSEEIVQKIGQIVKSIRKETYINLSRAHYSALEKSLRTGTLVLRSE